MRQEWDRLARAVDDARYEAGLDTLAAFVAESKISEKTARKIIEGMPVAPKILRTVERTFGWPPRTADRILRGEDVDMSVRKIARALGVSVAELEAGKEDQDGATQVPESIVAGLDRQSERTYTEGEVIDLITSSDMTAEQQLAAIKAFRKRRAEVERELADMQEGFRRQAEAESVQRQPVADNDGQPG